MEKINTVTDIYKPTNKMNVVIFGECNEILEKLNEFKNSISFNVIDNNDLNWMSVVSNLNPSHCDLLIFDFHHKLSAEKINALNNVMQNQQFPMIFIENNELSKNLFNFKFADQVKINGYCLPKDEQMLINHIKKLLIEFEAKLQLKMIFERFNDTFSSMHDCFVFFDENFKIIYMNDSSKKIIFGKSSPNIPIDFLKEVIFIDVKTEHNINDQIKIDAKKNITKKYPGLIKVDGDDSGENYFELMLCPVFASANHQIGCALTLHNVADLLKLTKELNYAATHDQLTKTFNKSYLLNKINEIIKDCRRTSEKFSLLFVDLDGFKTINDTLGHQAGDQLLVLVAQRLLNSIRATDICARVGGDEFVILLKNIKSESYAAKVAKNIIEQISFRFDVYQQEVFISASIGIACYPNDGDNVDLLIKHADMALYAAKEAGKNTQIFYDPLLQEKYERALKVIQGLNFALLNNEFQLYLQPIKFLNDEECHLVEALIRWNKNDSVIIQASEFIAIAEDSGFIKKIDLWVLENAILYLKNPTIINNNMHVAINISGVTLSEKNVANIILEKIKKHGIDPRRLHIEIAENSFVRNRKVLSETIQEFRRAGVQIAIDDFGTGYANLVHLRQFPVDYVKIDRTFISEIERSEKDFYVVRALVALATALDIRVIAEGVETYGQYQKIKACDCYAFQGYFYAKPMSLSDFEEFIHNSSTHQTKPN